MRISKLWAQMDVTAEKGLYINKGVAREAKRIRREEAEARLAQSAAGSSEA